MRLLGFQRVELQPGASCRVTMSTDPCLLARFDGGKQQWRIDEGDYTVAVSRAADAPVERKSVRPAGRAFGK